MMNKLLIMALIVALAAPLAGCGRKGALEPPPDAEPAREYPAE